MSVMEILRATRSVGARAPGVDGTRRWVRPLVGGALTAAASAAVVVGLTVLAVLGAARGTGEWLGALGAGSAVWLVGGGARLHLTGATIAFTPLLGAALTVLAASTGAGASLRPRGEEDPVTAAAWLGGYAGGGGLVALLTLLIPARPALVSLLLPLLGVPLAALGLVLLRRGLPPDRPWRLPKAVARGLRPGLEGAGLLVTLGAVLVLLSVLVRFGEVVHVTGELAAGVVGVVALSLVQVLALPNLALWALAFTAGPGFSVTEGAHAGLSGVESGLLPMVPALAAVPGPGSFPWPAHLLVLLPVAVGAAIARRCLSAMPRLARTRAKVGAVAVAVAVAALLLGVLDVVAGGSLGAQRLADIGSPARATTLALCVELGCGAALALARDGWSLRR